MKNEQGLPVSPDGRPAAVIQDYERYEKTRRGIELWRTWSYRIRDAESLLTFCLILRKSKRCRNTQQPITMPGRKLETILTENKLVSVEQLKQIARYAHAVGIDLQEAVLQKKIAPPDAVMMAYAESVGLPFIHLDEVSFDEEITVQVDPMTARQYSFVPISIDHGYVLVATTKPILPDVADELGMVFNLPVRCVICMPTELSAAIAKYYPRDASRIVKTDQAKAPPPEVKKPKAKKSKPVEPMNNADMKDRILKTFVAFNFSFAFVCFALNYLQIPRGLYNTAYHIPLLILLGIIAGGLAAFVTWKSLSRLNREQTQD